VLENPKSVPYHNFDVTQFNHPKQLTQWLIDKANDGKILEYPKGDNNDTSGN